MVKAQDRKLHCTYSNFPQPHWFPLVPPLGPSGRGFRDRRRKPNEERGNVEYMFEEKWHILSSEASREAASVSDDGFRSCHILMRFFPDAQGLIKCREAVFTPAHEQQGEICISTSLYFCIY